MELFMRNVPKDLNEDNLKKVLTPFMDRLGIVDWTCEKRRGISCSCVIFLVPNDGAKFLELHGKIPAPPSIFQSVPPIPRSQGPLGSQRPPRQRDIPRLRLLQCNVYVEQSSKAVNKQTLSYLQRERLARTKRPAAQEPQPSAINCTILEVACGKIVYSGFHQDEPTFAYQSGINIRGHGRFGRRYFTTTLGSDSRMDIPYEIIVTAIKGRNTLTLVLCGSPRFFITSSLNEKTQNKWIRVASFPSWPNHEKYAPHCLVYQLSMAPSPDEHDTISSLRSRQLFEVSLKGLAVDRHPTPFVDDYSTSIKAFEARLQSLEVARVVPFPILFLVQTTVWNNYLHPAIALQMLELIKYAGKELPHGVKGQFPLSIETFRQVIHKIPYPGPHTDAAAFNPENIMKQATELEAEKRNNDPLRTSVYGPSIPPKQAWVFKAVVTPTTITLQGPEAESKNRVLRLFPNHGDYFLRVSFMDENGQDLTYSPNISNDVVYERYRRILKEGIPIAGRRYSFLGFSHSSLRSHSTWFMAPFLDENLQRQDYDSILKKLGDFSEIRIAAKCAARIGQAFSETPYAVDLIKANIMSRRVPDVKTADGSRVFSDGVGAISREAMEELWKILPQRSAAPTCFQIRWGGVKGMLALDPTIPGKMIHTRDSMTKFPSDDRRELGICDVAVRPLRLYLNRQLIKILEDMRTNPYWFKAQQEKALRLLRGVTATAANTSTFIRYQSVGRPLGLSSFISRLHAMGIDYRRDDFLRSVVEHVVLRELRLLKHKARIPVDQGVALYGIMDETGWLGEDEVYITFDKTYARRGWRIKTAPADGPVIVTRSPALHPGDIQVANMRTPPPGHPLLEEANCIVFSQKGTRDLPSQLSGGDLDGDLYQVIWDREAMPEKIHMPADYPRAEPVELDRSVKSGDMADFFIDFMRTDILGLIATRHQILADDREEGTEDPDCIKLAEMHSTAVDFSKTGIPVNPQEMPQGQRIRPDFLAPAPPVKMYEHGQVAHIEDEDGDKDEDDDGMGPTKYKYYMSEKILGRLYRGVDEQKIWNEDINKAVDKRGPSVWDLLMTRVENGIKACGIDLDYESNAKQAWMIRSLYEDSMEGLMSQFSGDARSRLSEVETFCGSLLNKRGSQTRRQRDLSIKLLEETDRLTRWIVSLMRHSDKPSRDRGDYDGDDNDFDDDDEEGGVNLHDAKDEVETNGEKGGAAGKVTEDDSSKREKAVQLCWACLVVGCVKEGGTYHRGNGDMRSFRVVAAACLLRELTLLQAKAQDANVGGGGYVGVSGTSRFGGQTGLAMRPEQV
ncbi:hypothetical protein L249_3184 [Ophiocordyceps polyrhachis-furcata BCC 54312]|uniref:RNA-dependent RNA polymerase n=1 Tax=Ophiocordyceps polyrhachis-furcata BCC 54312 TaxID=1330021 RepID=A0A367LP91_9HYPO|nr:hypothetical protein L249_3184 [Ophiocordyceps polyrhachis-furcata BCC 54312]